MAPAWDFDLNRFMQEVNQKNYFGLDAEEPSLVKPSDYDYDQSQPNAFSPTELVSSGHEARRNDLMEQKARAESNAMDLLKQSLNKSAEVSPTQGFAAALLAAIPTLGGYMIGKSVGSPDLPEGYFEAGGTRAAAGLDKYQTGGAAGGLMGVEIGGKAAGTFLQGLDANQEQANKARVAMAELEKQKSGRLESQLATLENQAIAREDTQAFQKMMLDERTKAAQNTIGYRDRLKGDDDIVGFGDPVIDEAFKNISAGVGTREDYAALPPNLIEKANKNARSAAYTNSVQNTQDRFNTLQSYAGGGSATVVIDPTGNDPRLNAKRAEIKAQRNMAKNAATNLAMSYDKTSGAFFGGDRKKEEALASVIYSAARGLSGTGASLTGNEGAVIQAVSAPQMDINGFTSWFHDFLMKGDPAEQARIVAGALDKAFNEKLSGYGQAFSEYASVNGAATGENVPATGGGNIDQEIANLKAQIAAEEAKKGIR